MMLNLALILIFTMLVASAMNGITILYPLLAGLGLIILLSLKEGFRWDSILRMIVSGIRKPWKIYEITLLVGASASLWMACGTVPFLIYHGLTFIAPDFFVISLFLITCILALAIGSAFGTTGIIGVVFMVMARAGGVNPHIAAGAIITAAYFCERSTPLSSCANLVAILTGTDLYSYLKRLFTSTGIPFLGTLIFYLVLSYQNPLNGEFSQVATALEALFNLSPLAAFPALVVVLCVGLKADVRLTLALSIISACGVGVLVQGHGLFEVLEIMLRGFHLEAGKPLASTLQSGGMGAMVRPVMIIAVASAYSGLFEGTGMLVHFEKSIAKLVRRFGRFSAVMATSIVSACFGCSQTFAIITTHQFMAPYYDQTERGRSDLAQDIGNTAVIIPALVPWNVAFTIPAAILSVDTGFIPYALFLYLVPLYMWGRSIVHSSPKG